MMLRYSPRGSGAFTLAETMVAAAIGSLVLAMALTGSIMVQRSFLTSDFQATAQNDQLRLSDYLSRDLRPATSIAISRGGQQVDLRIPANNAPLLQVHLNVPVLDSLLNKAPAADRQVRYTLDGTDLYREENGARTRVARNLTTFTVARSGPVVTIASGFAPPYSRTTRVSQAPLGLRQSVLVRFAGN